jgi:hypothetical protein
MGSRLNPGFRGFRHVRDERRLVNRFKVRLAAVTCCLDAVREAVTKGHP